MPVVMSNFDLYVTSWNPDSSPRHLLTNFNLSGTAEGISLLVPKMALGYDVQRLGELESYGEALR